MMKVEPTTFEIRKLLDLAREGMIVVNPEYQRGSVWKQPQQKRLIDSILRGYPIPFFYLHHIKRAVDEFQSQVLEVIDGQQRIKAIRTFYEGGFKLYDPKSEAAQAKFPAFIVDEPCPWAGCSFDELPGDIKARFLGTELPIAQISSDNIHAPRDLFIRLQAGLPLNAQEKRDAWPGNFTEFVLKTAGKPDIDRYPGHAFFTNVMGAKKSSRGKYRQFCAQIAMLFFTRRSTGRLTDIKSADIDDFYYEHLDFDDKSVNAQRLIEIFHRLAVFFGDKKRPAMKAHEAMHLVLLIDTLMDDYAQSWERQVCLAFDEFRSRLAHDTKGRRDPDPGEYWTRYGSWTRTNADSALNIALRHQFFCEKMFELMEPLQLKDRKRAFGPLEREIIYHRDRKTCARCQGEVLWDDAEIHHVEEHHKGGRTTLANGVLVHARCHPKGQEAAEFAKSYRKAADA